MKEDFKEIIEQDIKSCQEQINSENVESIKDFEKELISKYSKIIDGFSDNLFGAWIDENASSAKKNIEMMMKKLLIFKAMDYTNTYAKKNNESFVINNSNNLELNMNVNFSEAKISIEEMSTLKENEKNEITSKIDELEKIVKSNEIKTKKWNKATEIIKWVADKSVDVGIVLLPLIMKIFS